MFSVAAVEDNGFDVASDLNKVAAAWKSHGLDPQKATVPLPDAGSNLLANLREG